MRVPRLRGERNNRERVMDKPTDGVCIIVGSSEHWHRREVALGLCHECSGDGQLYDDKTKTDVPCHKCNGAGKRAGAIVE